MGRLLKTFLISRELKKVIIRRSTELDLPLRHVCFDVGISYVRFMASYINSGMTDNCEISEDEFERLLETLGITVRFQFVIQKEFISRNKELKEKYEKYKYRNFESPDKKETDFTID